ncbi:hypothetical protein B0J12DRAFT_345543 [Macrophomina phaseolina]|uniref:Secreted protein n=1 Tax=Macrophomina phaseolina TaxID=35725 RepID=A0ABQ8GN58_9PEZI|nr:hypothetical protein B0J12DRAFT_345543 [Macrophomina phaseolina]
MSTALLVWRRVRLIGRCCSLVGALAGNQSRSVAHNSKHHDSRRHVPLCHRMNSCPVRDTAESRPVLAVCLTLCPTLRPFFSQFCHWTPCCPYSHSLLGPSSRPHAGVLNPGRRCVLEIVPTPAKATMLPPVPCLAPRAQMPENGSAVLLGIAGSEIPWTNSRHSDMTPTLSAAPAIYRRNQGIAPSLRPAIASY